MAGRFRILTLRVDELAGYRAAIIDCARTGEDELCERLLGQLSSLEAQAAGAGPDGELKFSPAPGAGALAARALDHLRTRPLRRGARASSR